MATTTIKVPVTLRDRLAERARQEHITLAAAIEQALDAADERAFWDAVRASHAALSEPAHAGRVADATLTDDLANEEDDRLSAEDAW